MTTGISAPPIGIINNTPTIKDTITIAQNNFEDCDIKIVNELVVKNDIAYTGKCAFYDDASGKIMSSHEYKEGKFHGKWKFYFPNGNLETIGKFQDGLRIGKWKYFYADGNLKQISMYKDGEKHGIWKVYDQEGNLTVKQEWENGIAVIDSTKNTQPELKIEGYDVTPIKND